jgi:predicted nuclease of predicted toxin-antitoxin system
MKLLFDQNLSPQLPRLLADIYADSTHVREVGLREADDSEIWDYAKTNGSRSSRKTQTFSTEVYCAVRRQNSFGCVLGIAP